MHPAEVPGSQFKLTATPSLTPTPTPALFQALGLPMPGVLLPSHSGSLNISGVKLSHMHGNTGLLEERKRDEEFAVEDSI